MRAATGWNVHRTNTTVAWPRQFELLSALWVIPRKRTFEAKERDGSKCHKPAGCWPRHKRTAPVFPSLKKRLQGSSLLLLSGEEAEVGTMGAGGPSIFRTPFREGPAKEESARKEAGIRRQPSVRQGKREQQRSQHNKINLKQQRRVGEPIQASGNTSKHRGASSQLAALTLMSTPEPAEPPHPQISRGTPASRPEKANKRRMHF